MRYLFALALIVTPVLPQTGFDVVSIKPGDPFSERQRIGISDSGSFEAIGVRLSDLIQQAYNIRPFQLMGPSRWMETDRYEIHTKDQQPGPSEAEIAQMSEEQRNAVRAQFLGKLQALLADRSVTLHGFAGPARVETRFEQRDGGSRCSRQRGEAIS